MKKSVGFIGKIILYVMLLALAYLTLYPILYTFFGSFKTTQELMTSSAKILPDSFSFENYKKAWMLADFKTYTFNSIFLTFFSVIGVVTTSSMTGYVFSRGNFRGKKLIFTVFTASMFICLGTIVLYPKVEIAKFLHINRSLWGVIIMYVFGVNVTNIYLVKGFVDSLPKEIDEAAIIDGCNFGGVFFRVLLPLIKPILATIAILTFKNVWNDYLLPMVFTIGSPKRMPLIVGVISLKNSGEAAASWDIMLAGTMMSVVPMITVYLVLNRYFVEGLTSGAVKG